MMSKVSWPPKGWNPKEHYTDTPRDVFEKLLSVHVASALSPNLPQMAKAAKVAEVKAHWRRLWKDAEAETS